jgi:dihydrofolate reductase
MAGKRGAEARTTRRVRYGVAMSLDGYIAGPNGEYDWISHDPDIDFAAMFAQFDTLLIGRKTYEAAQRVEGGAAWPGVKAFVISRTLKPVDHPRVTIASDARALVTELQRQPGKDIWLFGGGELFRSLLADGLVNGVDVAIVPVLLGGGVPLLPSPADRTRLTLRKHRVYEGSGIVALEYDAVPVRPRRYPAKR